MTPTHADRAHVVDPMQVAPVQIDAMHTRPGHTGLAHVDLYWLPLGAGDALPLVRWSGRAYEAIAARHHRREARDLYHSALEVQVGDDRYVIEMAPVWQNKETGRGVVGEGPVGLPWLGRCRFFRYEVRRWRGGIIPDLARAVASPQRVSMDVNRAQRVLDLVLEFPTVTWGRDELRTGEMWNSNSLTAWLVSRSGHDPDVVDLPTNGRAPGWQAGLAVAAREIAARPPI